MSASREPDRFYVLLADAGSGHDTEMFEDDPVNLGEAPRCERCRRYVGAKPWLPPHRAQLALHGSTWADFAFRDGAETDVLISERAAGLWRAARLRGFSGFERVAITRERGAILPAPQYAHVVVTRGGAAIAEKQSSLVRSEQMVCDVCRSAGVLDVVRGFRLEPGTWTGEDVFVPRGLPGTVVVTPDFKTWVEANEISNVLLTATEAYEWDSIGPASHSP